MTLMYWATFHSIALLERNVTVQSPKAGLRTFDIADCWGDAVLLFTDAAACGHHEGSEQPNEMHHTATPRDQFIWPLISAVGIFCCGRVSALFMV